MSWTELAHGRRDDGAGHARFALHDDPATRAIWPHPFAAELSVTIFGDTLETALLIRNTGDAPFTFTAALHSYLRVTDVGTVRSEEHTSELQSLMRISYAVFCLKTKRPKDQPIHLSQSTHYSTHKVKHNTPYHT